MSTPGNSPNQKLHARCTMLVTRPDHQAAPLISLIESSGARAYKFPAIEIKSVEDRPAFLAKLKTLSTIDYAFFVSPNAVTHCLSAVSESIGSLPASLKLACVGAGTVAALDAAGYQCHVSPDENYNSEALLALPELQNVSNKKIVIFRGNGGRDKLRDELASRGAQVEYIECYQRTRPTTNIGPLIGELENSNIDIIGFTSADAARNIVAMLGDQVHLILKLPLVVVSQRIADVCRQLGFKDEIMLAKTASNEAIFSCMHEWCKENKNQ